MDDTSKESIEGGHSALQQVRIAFSALKSNKLPDFKIE
jgi:hypothetical protein